MKRRPATDRAAGRQPGEDELGLFERAMQGTRQLSPSPKPAPAVVAPLAPVRAAKQPTRAAPTSPAPPRAPPAPPPGLDRRTAERLRRGQMPIDAKLDLHGFHQAAAHRALRAFVLASRAAGRRCLLLVHGRGESRGDGEGRGVLRRNVPRWLGEAELAKCVLAVAAARPEHGGDGALYVLLRRERGK